MLQFNLLPWREQRRKEKKKKFGYTVGSFIGLTIIVIFFIHLHYTGLIKAQSNRNAFLKSEVSSENQTLLKLNDKVNEGEVIDNELHYLMALRAKSYQAVSLLDELARVVPDAVTLTLVSRENDKIIIKGKAISDYQITLMMKNMSNSQIFNQPELNKIASQDNTGSDSTFFQLNVVQKGQ